MDNKKIFGAFLTNLLKAFGCVSHDLLIGKLHSYGLSFPAIKLMQDYLKIANKELKLGPPIVTSMIFELVFRKFPFLDQFFLLFSLVIYFWIEEIIISLTMQMIQLLT